MKSKELIKSLIADSRLAEVSGIFKYEDTEKGNTNYELLDNMFGVTVNIIGTLKDCTDYLYQYSDTCDSTFGIIPDAIVILQEDGKCVFLYAIE